MKNKVIELLNNSDLNWNVVKKQLFSSEGYQTESFGVFREDSNTWLGTVGERYTPFQNFDLAETIFLATEGLNIEVTRGGLLYGGQKVYLQAELPNEYIGKSNIQRWITALNSHDGSTSIAFGSSNTVVVCQNTFFRAYGELQKFRHTTSVKERIEIARNDLRQTLLLDQKLMDNFKVMAELPLIDEPIERVIRGIFNVDKETKTEEISTRKKNQVIDFSKALQQSVNEQGSTIWALFNGVTRYVNHITAPSEISKKMDYLMINGGSEIMNNGFDIIKQYIDEAKPKFDLFQIQN